MSEKKDRNRYIAGFLKGLNNVPMEIGANGKIEKRKSPRTEAERVVGALSIVNAISLTVGFEDGNATEEDGAEVEEFVEWFYDLYGENDVILSAIDKNWPDEARIFRLNRQIVTAQLAAEMRESWDSLQESEQEKAEAVTSLIWSHRVDREIMVTVSENDSYTMVFPKVIAKKELEAARNMLLFAVGDFMYRGGVMLYRKSTGTKKDKVYGFMSQELKGKRTVVSYPVEKLRIACETMPDGSRHVWEDDDYDVIELPWEKSRSQFRLVK